MPGKQAGNELLGNSPVHGIVTKHLWAYLLLVQSRHFLGCCCDMFRYEILHAIGAQPTTTAIGKQHIVAMVSGFVDPGSEYHRCPLRQRPAALFSTFVHAPNVGTWAKDYIVFPQGRELLRGVRLLMRGALMGIAVAKPTSDNGLSKSVTSKERGL
jgi:hypothetical protein